MDKESVIESRRTFGLKLQDLRESQGISIEGLAQTTRIGQSFIKALEDGDFEKLPGQVFGRGFVRSLIKTMGADEKEWTAAYNEAFGQAIGTESHGRGFHSRGSSPSAGTLATAHLAKGSIGFHRKEWGLAKNFSASFPRSPRGPRSRRNSRGARSSKYFRGFRTLGSLNRFFPYWVSGPIVLVLGLGIVTLAVAVLGKIGFDQPMAQLWSSLRSQAPEAPSISKKEVNGQTAQTDLAEALEVPLFYREIYEFWRPYAASTWQERGRPIPLISPPWPTELLLSLPREYLGPMEAQLMGARQEWVLLFASDGSSRGVQDDLKVLQTLGQGNGQKADLSPIFEKGVQPNGNISPSALGVASDPTGRLDESVFQNGAQEITLVVVEAVKVKFGLDGAPMKVIELKPETYRYQFKDRADLLVYDAGSLSIRFNGKDLGALGQKGRIRRLSFKADQDSVSGE